MQCGQGFLPGKKSGVDGDWQLYCRVKAANKSSAELNVRKEQNSKL